MRTLVSEALEAGKMYRAAWAGKDDHGVEQSSGIYFYELRAGDSREARNNDLCEIVRIRFEGRVLSECSRPGSTRHAPKGTILITTVKVTAFVMASLPSF